VRAVADTAESPKPPLSEWSVAREVTQYSSAFDRIREQGAVALYVSESDNQGIFKWVDNKGTRGFDLKLADAIRAELAAGLGKPLKPVQAAAVKWDTLLDRPRNGEADIIVASVTRKADRKQKHGIDFSESYFCTTYAFMYRASERDRALPEMLDGRTIGVQKDTTGADLAAALRRNKAFEIREYPNTETISRDIINSRIDFAITDTPFAMAEELKYKNAGRNRVVYKEFGKDDFPAAFPVDLQFQEYVVVTRDGEDKLLSAINTAIAKAKRDGSLVRFLREAMAEFEESNGLVHDANDRSPGSGRPWECRR
jgi:polar amino acid transport system substrate-binding protein